MLNCMVAKTSFAAVKTLMGVRDHKVQARTQSGNRACSAPERTALLGRPQRASSRRNSAQSENRRHGQDIEQARERSGSCSLLFPYSVTVGATLWAFAVLRARLGQATDYRAQHHCDSDRRDRNLYWFS